MLDGTTERVNLEAVARRTGKRPKALDGPELPPDGAHVWDWFVALSRARGSNGFGPSAISYQDLAAWVALTGTLVRPSEVEAIMLLDGKWMHEQAEQARAAERRTKGSNGANR